MPRPRCAAVKELLPRGRWRGWQQLDNLLMRGEVGSGFKSMAAEFV